MAQNVESSSENQESVVGRILESDILDGCVGYKYPTYGLLKEIVYFLPPPDFPLPDGGLLPRPPPDGLPVLLGQFGLLLPV